MRGLLDPDDPRPLLPVIAVCGLVAWKLPFLELLALCAVSMTVAVTCLLRRTRSDLAAGPDRRGTLRIARGVLLFALSWSGVAFLLELAGSAPMEQAVQSSGTLAMRLLTVSALGICLVSTASPRALALAMSWYLRPLLGKRAWEAALALGLMIHFLPLALATLNESREAVRLRLPRCSLRRRTTLVISSALRRLTQKSWDQAVAVASRRLDRPEVWLPASRPAALPMLEALLLCLACIGLLYLDDISRLLV